MGNCRMRDIDVEWQLELGYGVRVKVMARTWVRVRCRIVF